MRTLYNCTWRFENMPRYEYYMVTRGVLGVYPCVPPPEAEATHACPLSLSCVSCGGATGRSAQAIDEHVDTRRKRRREEAQIEAMKKEREERPKISDQFADLKVSARRNCYGEYVCTFFFNI